jgi:inorganic phosphate transporter, PiT family
VEPADLAGRLPSSSSHALFGGLIGVTWVAAGADAVKFAGVVSKVLLPAVLSPIIAGVVALIATYLAYRITARGADGTDPGPRPRLDRRR